MTAEVLVIGAGPAGLCAAAAAREAGAEVRLLDAADATGGQYWRDLPASRSDGSEFALHHDWAHYVRLRESLESDPGVRIDLGAHVWALGREDLGIRVDVVHGQADGTERATERIRTRSLVLATGAYDRALPIPGWTLPGVFTAGAAQALAKGERVAVGKRVIVAGAGPFLLPVSQALGQTGARVVAVVEAGRPGHLARAWLRRPGELLAARGKAAELGGYVWDMLRRRVPYRAGRGVVEIHGRHEVEAVTIARLDARWRPIPGTERRFDCDAVCLGHGFTPRLELAIAAGCRLDERRFVEVDDAQLTTVPGVYAAGELTGIGGADLAQAEGRIAGWAAAGGALDADPLAPARRARSRMRGFAARIEDAHGIGADWPRWLRDDTVVCRCEEVDRATLRRVAAGTDASGLRSLKLTTRAGLGACQGRVCGRTVEQLLEPHLTTPGGTRSEVVGTDRRPVAAPLRLGELARYGEPSATPSCSAPRKEQP
ncbi:MAG: FAD-dependent oxidoreductase [Nocardioides sp.]|nr:FAD-dependent oxidoreductase [Nocardioides sp.]